MALDNMLELITLEEFDEVFKIMEDSFITDEYRNYKEQKELLNNPLYNLYLIKEQDEVCGFLAMWNFEEFIFLEHLAIKEEKRNQGIGRKLLKYLISTESKLMCLEVELPEEELKQRRIKFYERNGFVLNEYDYIQPPMSEGKNFVPLMIMSTKKIKNKEEFDKIKNILYKNVYKFTNNQKI